MAIAIESEADVVKKGNERPRYWTTFQLAERANCSPVTIYRAIKDRKIRASRTPGGHYRIAAAEAEAFLRGIVENS